MKIAFSILVFVIGVFFVQSSYSAPASDPAQDQAEPLPMDVEELETLIQNARERIAFIDEQLHRLEQEKQTLYGVSRDAHREHFSARQRIMQEDETIQALIGRLEVLQREMNEVQEELARRMSEHPDYINQRTIQTTAAENAGEVHRETLKLANDRVAVLLELQGLERKLAERTNAAGSDPDEDGAVYSAEDSKQ